MDQFNRLEQYAKLQKPPAVKFKDLEAAVTTSIRFNTLPMKVRVDYIPVTASSIFAAITIQFDRKDLQYAQKDGVARATVNMYARLSNMARRTVNVFEDTVSVEVPSELLQQAMTGQSVYQKIVPLPPGKYRMNIVAKDTTGGNMTSYEQAIDVPRLDEDKLTHSSVILADLIEPVPTKSIGTGPFVIGSSKVRPRVSDTFRRDEKLGIYCQLYNFQTDETTHKPNGVVEYEIVKNGSNEKVLEYSEELAKLKGSASQITIEKLLPLKSLQPGQYTLRMKVEDKVAKQTITPTASFTVE
jgi:hypothetical protein